MNGEKLNPRVDIVFKKIFGVDENKDLLISLINSIIDENDQIKDLTIKNPYNDKNFKADKMSVLDIKAEGLNGKIFNIEMQITDEANYDKRALYYWAKSYTSQLGSGQTYGKLQKTFGIHILNFLSIPESPKYHNVFKLEEKDVDIKRFQDIELHTIELSKFDKDLDANLAKILEKVKTKLDKWSTFFTHPEILQAEQVPSLLDEADLKKAAHVVEVMSFSKEEREVYENRSKWLMMEEEALNKRFDDGIEQGKIEEKLEIAKKMLEDKLSIQMIAKYSGLSLEEIKKLQF